MAASRCTSSVAGRWRRRQRLSTTPLTSLTGLSSAAASCWWATLASVLAAPLLLWRTPSRHPIGEACVAIVGSAGSTDRSASSTLARAALSMHPAAPFFLAHRPSHHPIGEAVSAIVWVGRRSYRYRHWCWHWHWRRGDWLRASNVVDPAAPRPFVCFPHVRRVHRAIEGVNWSDRPRRRHRARRRPWRSRRWGRWRRWRGSRPHSCNERRCDRATHASCAAAILLL